MTIYRINKEKDGLELVFDKIPSFQIRESLKKSGWRWSKFGGFWYNKNTPLNETTAKLLAGGQVAETQAQAPAQTQSKKSVFTADYVDDKITSDDMAGYVKLSSGYYVPFKKNHINTHFCYSYNELDYETVDKADDLANSVCSDYDFFQAEQLDEINKEIEIYQHAIEIQKRKEAGELSYWCGNDLVFLYPDTWRGEKIASAQCWNPENKTIEEALKIDDLQLLLEAWQEMKEKKIKQCKTYWKRYGGSKLHSWTYSIND